ncbi:MAG: FHA domain-containing protein [Burkholderiales bacterium]|nr:FHA domain-containing protein [Burkholderiales bacterium]
MAKLVLSMNGSVLGNYFLEKERFSFGRKPTCDIQINDQGVSKEHAVILTVGNDQILEDLGSTNGTLVNGEKVQRHILQNGDVIEVGRYKLRFVNAKAMPDMDFDKTLMIPAFDRTKLKQEGAVKDEADTQSIATAAANARNVKTIFPLGAVRGISGENTGREIDLSRSITTLGKPDNSAIITRRPVGYFITHVVGKKHPIVNGKAIGDDPYPLDNLDQIEVGVDKLQFYLK